MVLWDVDGTLVRAGDIGAAVFDTAFESVLGVRPPSRIRMSGKTDPQIVREYLALMDQAEDPGVVEAVLAGIESGLAAAARAGVLNEQGAACAGVDLVLAKLHGEPQVVQTLLTGNVYANALVKVGAYGLDRWLDLELGAYGSDSDDRNRLVPVAIDRLQAKRGVRLAASQVWVVGDTPRDLACARAAGARCLLVATGRYTYSELSGLGADATMADLTDAGAVVALITEGLQLPA